MEKITRKAVTFRALERFLLNGNEIDTEYLNQQIILWGMNTKEFYHAIMKTRRSVHGLCFEIFADLVDNNLQFYGPYRATYYQLKVWLCQYGNGYDTLKEAIDYFATERQEYN